MQAQALSPSSPRHLNAPTKEFTGDPSQLREVPEELRDLLTEYTTSERKVPAVLNVPVPPPPRSKTLAVVGMVGALTGALEAARLPFGVGNWLCAAGALIGGASAGPAVQGLLLGSNPSLEQQAMVSFVPSLPGSLGFAALNGSFAIDDARRFGLGLGNCIAGIAALNQLGFTINHAIPVAALLTGRSPSADGFNRVWLMTVAAACGGLACASAQDAWDNGVSLASAGYVLAGLVAGGVSTITYAAARGDRVLGSPRVWVPTLSVVNGLGMAVALGKSLWR